MISSLTRQAETVSGIHYRPTSRFQDSYIVFVHGP